MISNKQQELIKRKSNDMEIKVLKRKDSTSKPYMMLILIEKEMLVNKDNSLMK